MGETKTIEPETLVMVDGKGTAAPHDIVEMGFQSWSKIWGRLADRGGTPWRQEEAAEEDEATALPAIIGKDLRKASRTFKERTGTGTDKLGPRHYA